jgi:DNA-binding NtrC family response regulator
MSIANILLVDDEIPFVDAMTRRLGKRDLSVQSAYSAAEAFEKLAQTDAIEVVILDIKMPGMDGMEALKEIRRRFPLVEVIMLTGHATVESGIEGMKQGAFDYLMKPCNIDDLVAKVQEAAKKKRLHEEKIIQARIKEITSRKA